MVNYKRVKNLLLHPIQEWEIIKNEEQTPGSIISSYVIPLAALPSFASLIGYTFIGKSFEHIGNYHSLNWGLSVSISLFVGAIICTVLAAVIIDALSGYFGSEKNSVKTTSLVAYPFTPVWVAGIFNIIPAFDFISVLGGFYGFYIMFLGLKPMKNTSEDKQIPFIIVSGLIVVILYLLVTLALSAILGLFGLGMNASYTDMPSL